jgi:hypothetical protein
VRFYCALIAGALAGRAAYTPEARADGVDPRDPRDAFGLRRQPQAAELPGCEGGQAFHCAMATDPLDDATPYALSTWLPASYLLRLPVGDATHDRVASYALGATSSGAGPMFGGATGLENRWTIDGAPADDPRTGGSDTRIPLVFLDELRITAGGFSARDRASTGGTIDARLRRGTAGHEVTADAWATAVREPQALAAGYAVRRASVAAGPSDTASVVATGPVHALDRALGGAVWYAAGLAPTFAASDVRWRAARLVDGDGNGVADGSPGDPALSPIDTRSTRTLDVLAPAMARLGLDRGPHHVDVSLIGEVQRDTGFLANATLPAAGVDRVAVIGDAIATWRAAWAATHARVQLAWHHSARRESAHDSAAAAIPQLLSGYVPASLPDDPALAAACDDASSLDPAPRIANCPVSSLPFASGGAGRLTRTLANRPSATADVAHRIADHVVRAGATIEDTRLATASSFTGGELDRSSAPDQQSRQRFYDGACSGGAGEPCQEASRSKLDYHTVYAAAYVEDTYVPVPGLSIDAGLRWELMWVGPHLRFSRQLAPRLGVVWDALGGGRSRLWASAGTAFAMLPAGLGATVIQRDATVTDTQLAGAASRTLDSGAAYPVAPGVEPVAQDEITLGAEIALVGALRATLWGQGRRLRRGLETTRDGFDNPGAGGDIPASRHSEIVGFALEMRQLERTAIRAAVMWGRTTGSWTGPYDSDPGGANGAAQATALLQGPDWDATASNLYGPLPSDPGASMFVEAERRGTLGAADVSVATRLTVGSGAPRGVVGGSPDGRVELLPRGSAGRNPVIAQANLRLAARWRGVTATLDILNVFDRRDPTNVDELYSADAAGPITGGSYEDLVFLRTASGGAAHRQAAFQQPTDLVSPLSISVGIHKAF